MTLDFYEEIAELDSDYIPDLLEPYIEACLNSNAKQRAYQMLQKWNDNYQGISLVLKLTDFMAEDKGSEEAGQFLISQLASRPSARGLDRLIDLKADGHLDPESSDDILKAVTSRLMARQNRFRCSNCGFSGHTHHWQCPSCRHWGTTKTIHGVLGE